MGIARWSVVITSLAVTAVTARTASACGTIKICPAEPTAPARRVPENPSFVVPWNNVQDVIESYGDGNVSVDWLDDDWAWVTIAAHAGDELSVHTDVVCGGNRAFVVDADWHESIPQPELLDAILQRNSDDTWRSVKVTLKPSAWWTRAEWASSEAGVEQGQAQTLLLGLRRWDHFNIPLQPHQDRVYLRLTGLGPDGSTADPWQGWIRIDGDVARVEAQARLGSVARAPELVVPQRVLAAPITRAGTMPVAIATPDIDVAASADEPHDSAKIATIVLLCAIALLFGRSQQTTITETGHGVR
jgi:hypothetical protein